MSKRIFSLAALLVFVLALEFSFAVVTQEAAAGPCETCLWPCGCHAFDLEWGHGPQNSNCDVMFCGHCDPPCY